MFTRGLIRLFLGRELLHSYDMGQWAAFNRVLSYINTQDTNLIDKKKLYSTVFDMRPR